MLDVSVIFVNYKTYDMTISAVKEVVKKTDNVNYEIIVVDNSANHENFIEMKSVLACYGVICVETGENLGFGKANNFGASLSRGRYLYFLNTDIELVGNAIYDLFVFCDRCGEFIIAGSNLLTKNGQENHSYRNHKTVLWDLINNSGLTRLLEKICHRRADFNYSLKPKLINGYVCGASLMISKLLFDKIGGFEKEIFMYAEEALLCFKAIHDFGATVYNVPSSKVIHFEGGSSGDAPSIARIKMMIDGNFIYYKKAYSKNVALRYLRSQRNLYRIKRLLSFFKKAKRFYNKELEKAYSDKIVKELADV